VKKVLQREVARVRFRTQYLPFKCTRGWLRMRESGVGLIRSIFGVSGSNNPPSFAIASTSRATSASHWLRVVEAGAHIRIQEHLSPLSRLTKMSGLLSQLKIFSRITQSLPAFGLVLLISLSVGASDRVRFKTWNAENGLPQQTVNSIVQTPDGYLWLATFDGLARFDGSRFKIFKKSNTPALPMNRISNLYVDTDGRLWIWTEDPNTLVLCEQGKFRAFLKGTDFHADDIDHPSTVDGVPRFLSGTDSYAYSQGKFERRQADEIKLPRVFYSPDLKSAWITTSDGFYAFDGKQSKFYQKDAQLPLDPRRAPVGGYLEVDGDLWFLVPFPGAGGMRLCVFRNGHLQASSVSIEQPRFFEVDRERNLWLGDFYYGVRKITIASLREDDPSKLKVEHYLQADGLASNKTKAMLADKDGNIWIGTVNGLQLLIDQPPVTFYAKTSGLPTENIYSVVQDRTGTIWFGAWDDYLVGYANNVFTAELQKFVQALFVDHDSRLWVGAEGGVYHRENASSKWSSLYEQLKTPAAERLVVTVISQDRNGDIWFGGSGGIARYHGGQIKTFRDADGLPGMEVASFLQTRSGVIWVGTNTGMAQLVGDRFIPLTWGQRLFRPYVRSLYEDRDGALWIGTYDSGIFRLKNNQLANVNSAKGLFSDGVFCILEDDDDWFWMNSNQGIYRVKRDELNKFADGQIPSVNSVSYGPDDGLLNVEGNGGRQPAGLKASDGKLWFPTAGGIAVIDRRKATRNASALPTLIEDVRVDQNETEPQSGVITVAPGQATVDIAYTAMSFVGPNLVRFRYRLEGLDANWTEAGSRRVAYFSHLPYGQYTFRVIAANADGVWTDSGATIRLVVLTPFYRRTWFYSLVGLALLSIISALYLYRMRQLQVVNAARADFTRRLIDSQENERRRLALEVHDSLGQSLVVIRNRALMSLNNPDEHQRMVDQMREISEASAAALQEARQIAHNLHPGQIEHLGLPAALLTLVESVQGGTSIKFETKIEQPRATVSRDEAINIYRIAQESLSNLIKHSHADRAIVALFETNGRLYFKVEDNGRGVPGGTSDGLGLKGIRERAQIINADLEIESTAGKGTQLTVSLRPDSEV
jgi:signal transduction histidine kinase/ligand-binding sensor domain-containing protein